MVPAHTWSSQAVAQGGKPRQSLGSSELGTQGWGEGGLGGQVAGAHEAEPKGRLLHWESARRHEHMSEPLPGGERTARRGEQGRPQAPTRLETAAVPTSQGHAPTAPRDRACHHTCAAKVLPSGSGPT